MIFPRQIKGPDPMSKEEDNKAVIVRWFTEFWGKDVSLSVVEEIAAPDMLLKYSLHEPAARGWFSPSDCAFPAILPDRPARRRHSGRRAPPTRRGGPRAADYRSEEHTSELQSLMRI